MSLTAKAALLAREFPEPAKMGRPKAGEEKSTESGDFSDLTSADSAEVDVGISERVMRDARFVVRWADDLLDAVIYRGASFDAAMAAPSRRGCLEGQPTQTATAVPSAR